MKHSVCSALALYVASAAHAGSVVMTYGFDVGGNNTSGTGGLSAQAEYEMIDDILRVTLTNTSTGAPASAEISDRLLVSLGFELPGSATILDGLSAEIGDGSQGLGRWSSLTEGDSVADEWVWTNSGGGDLFEDFSQVISTSNGTHDRTGFGGSDSVNGPFGGIAADDSGNWGGNKRGVDHAIEFRLRLSRELTGAELFELASSAMAEFGSDYQYVQNEIFVRSVPLPGAGAMGLAGLGVIASRRGRESRVRSLS